jgi:hypothetical protein
MTTRDTYTNRTARCPACLKTLDGAYNPWNDATPEAGDISICAYCTTLLAFADDLTLRTLPVAVYEALSPAVQRQLSLIRELAAARILRDGNERSYDDV